jgi:hypothetical protein
MPTKRSITLDGMDMQLKLQEFPNILSPWMICLNVDGKDRIFTIKNVDKFINTVYVIGDIELDTSKNEALLNDMVAHFKSKE